MPLTSYNATDHKALLARYYNLPQPYDKIQLMYVWIDGTGEHLRCKTMTVSEEPMTPEDCRMWSFDGSSTGQAEGSNSDVYLKPCALFPDPFRGGKNKLVLCGTYTYNMKPHSTNHRSRCAQVMEAAKDHEPWFGVQQEYALMDVDGYPMQWPKAGYPQSQGPYYCSVGTGRALGRDIPEAHYRACLYAGVKISGTNSEIMPSQWGFQIGPCEGVTAADHLWMARFLLHRVAEDFGVVVTFAPKPVPGDWNASAARVHFSTAAMRSPEGGFKAIGTVVEKLAKRHSEHHEANHPKQSHEYCRNRSGQYEAGSFHGFSAAMVEHRMA